MLVPRVVISQALKNHWMSGLLDTIITPFILDAGLVVGNADFAEVPPMKAPPQDSSLAGVMSPDTLVIASEIKIDETTGQE